VARESAKTDEEISEKINFLNLLHTYSKETPQLTYLFAVPDSPRARLA